MQSHPANQGGPIYYQKLKHMVVDRGSEWLKSFHVFRSSLPQGAERTILRVFHDIVLIILHVSYKCVCRYVTAFSKHNFAVSFSRRDAPTVYFRDMSVFICRSAARTRCMLAHGARACFLLASPRRAVPRKVACA